MAVRTRCDLLSVEGDPARVMEVTQRIAEQFEKTEKLLGISVPMSNGKKTYGDGGEVAVGASVKMAGSSPKKTSSFKGRCDDCGENGHRWRDCQKRFGRGGDGARKRSQQSQDGFRINDNGNRAGKPWPICAERPNSGIGDDCVQGSSCRTRALKEEEKLPRSRT